MVFVVANYLYQKKYIIFSDNFLYSHAISLSKIYNILHFSIIINKIVNSFHDETLHAIIQMEIPVYFCKNRMEIPTMKKFLKIILVCTSLVLFALVFLIAYLSFTEYVPGSRETVDFTGSQSDSPSGETFPDPTATLSVMSWNIGYAGLSETADFFMDGGKGVRTQDKESVMNNLSAVLDEISEADPDILFLQEIDRNSTRSYHIDETSFIREKYEKGSAAFANNFKVNFVPYPIPPIGKVDSGVMTLTDYTVTDAVRIQLPCPFSWPVRTANLKRCLLTCRIPIKKQDNTGNGKDSEKKELVLVNLHLEAYDDGAGKEAQTRMLEELLQEEYDKGNYVIAGGDFNQSFSGTDTSMYPLQEEGLWQCGMIDESSFSNNFRFLMDNSTPTCRSLDRPYDPDDKSFQYYMIDGFIVSDNVNVEKIQTLDCGFKNSDHNPVFMTFSLR